MSLTKENLMRAFSGESQARNRYTLAAEAAGDGVLLNGRVTDSPNSDVLECGFLYGNDTLRVKLKSEEVSLLFSAYADSLQNGNYYAVAYARNGVGTSYGDTVRFQINK